MTGSGKTAEKRTPRQILGHDAYSQLVFEGYEVVPMAAPFECEDCLGMSEHGCYCEAMGACHPGGPVSTVDGFWRELCEKDDRTSPAEYPDMVLITKNELADFIGRATPIESAPAAGVEAYKAENAKHGWTGRGFAFDGGCLNLSRDGSAEFVFDMDEAEPYNEEGKDLLLAKVPASEVEALRDLFVKAYPVAPAAGVKALEVARKATPLYCCPTCPEDINCHPAGEMAIRGDELICYECLADSGEQADADLSAVLKDTTPSSPDVELQQAKQEADDLEDQLHQWEREANYQKTRASSAVKALEHCNTICTHALEHYKGPVAMKIRREIHVHVGRTLQSIRGGAE